MMHSSHTPTNAPTKRVWSLLVEALVGAGMGVLLAFGGGYLGPWLTQGVNNGWNDLVSSVLGALLGYIVGASLGVIIGGRLLRQRGVAWRAVLGSVVGGVAVVLLAEPLRLNQRSWLLMLVFAGVVLLSALWGYQERGARTT